MSALKICPQCGTEYELDQRFCPKDGSTLKSQNAAGDLVGSIIADRYHVLKKLGEGGMGTVYLAEHVKMGRKSAVKVMNPGMMNDADAISRFNREAANASRISHPNVAAVYDFGETPDGMIYLAMECIEGPVLTSIIEQAGPMPPIRAAEITRQAAEALAVAHDMGIVHRDLKPDNIMLAKNRDGTDLVKVVDFGIAKAANNEAQKVTKTGLVVGTPEYMSPEQLAGDKLDGRSDIYSLALVSFAMLTGKLPFPGETVQESMIARLTDEPKRLGEMKPDIIWPPAVQAVMDKALQRDAALRYGSASEFGRDLFQAVSAMPESAATSAFTAVMNRLSTPPNPTPVVPPVANGTSVIPQTRVNRASSREAPVVGDARTKRRWPVRVAASVLVLAGASYAALVTYRNAQTGQTAQTDTLNSGGTVGTRSAAPPPAPAPAPVVNLTATFALVDSLTDFEKGANLQSARQAQDRLDSIAPFAVAPADSLRVLYLRAMSHFVIASELADGSPSQTRERQLGCDILRDNEGKLMGTPSRERVRFFLYGDPGNSVAPTCDRRA